MVPPHSQVHRLDWLPHHKLARWACKTPASLLPRHPRQPVPMAPRPAAAPCLQRQAGAQAQALATTRHKGMRARGALHPPCTILLLRNTQLFLPAHHWQPLPMMAPSPCMVGRHACCAEPLQHMLTTAGAPSSGEHEIQEHNGARHTAPAMHDFATAQRRCLPAHRSCTHTNPHAPVQRS